MIKVGMIGAIAVAGGLFFGGCKSETADGGAGTTAFGTGGVPVGTGGVPVGTGGVPVGTGGVAAGTGGVPVGTGGVAAGTGGMGTGGMGTGGMGTGGMGTGGMGTGGMGTGGMGTGGAGAATTATATIAGFGTGTVTGTAKFTQTGTDVTLVVTLANCPNGVHGVHIHQGTSCADATMQGAHWDTTRGEGIPDVTCAGMTGTSMVTRKADMPMLAWSVGGAAATNVIGHAFVVHDPAATMPPRIGCGLIK